MDSLFFSLYLILTVKTTTGSLLHPAPHTPDSPPVGIEDCTWTAGDGTTMHHVQPKKKKEEDNNVILGDSLLSVEYHLNQSHDTSM